MESAAPTEAGWLDRLGQELLALLDRQAASLERLERQAERIHQAVSRRAIEKLVAEVMASEAALAEHEALERRWHGAVAALAERVGEPAKRVSLARLAEQLPEPRGRALLEAGQRLRSRTERLADRTRRNQQLLVASSRVVDDCLAFLNMLRARGEGYTADGRSAEGRSGSQFLDWRA